jgi:hypothetical protein
MQLTSGRLLGSVDWGGAIPRIWRVPPKGSATGLAWSEEGRSRLSPTVAGTPWVISSPLLADSGMSRSVRVLREIDRMASTQAVARGPQAFFQTHWGGQLGASPAPLAAWGRSFRGRTFQPGNWGSNKMSLCRWTFQIARVKSLRRHSSLMLLPQPQARFWNKSAHEYVHDSPHAAATSNLTIAARASIWRAFKFISDA